MTTAAAPTAYGSGQAEAVIEQRPAVGVGSLIEQVRRGDQAAATELVRRYSPMMYAVARGAGLGEHRSHDVVQTAWLRLFEDPGRVRDPEHLGGWLRTVTTREAWRTCGLSRRELSVGEGLDALADAEAVTDSDHLDRMSADEEIGWLRVAIAMLPQRQRRLLEALSQDPQPSYEEISARTGMPVGSIGPTRQRAVERLRILRRLHEGGAAGQPGRAATRPHPRPALVAS